MVSAGEQVFTPTVTGGLVNASTVAGPATTLSCPGTGVSGLGVMSVGLICTTPAFSGLTKKPPWLALGPIPTEFPGAVQLEFVQKVAPPGGLGASVIVLPEPPALVGLPDASSICSVAA